MSLLTDLIERAVNRFLMLGLLSLTAPGDPKSRAIQTSAPHARQPLNHLDQVSLSTPYNHLVLSRARNYSGTATHRLAAQEKSSGKIKDGWMFRLVSL